MTSKRIFLILIAAVLMLSVLAFASCGLIEEAYRVPIEIESIEYLGSKEFPVYQQGMPKLKILVKYVDGSEKEVAVTEDMLWGKFDFTQSGRYNVTISYNGKTCTVQLTVGNPDAESDGGANTEPDPEPIPQPNYVKVYFISPVAYTDIGLSYTSGIGDDLFVFNPTLGFWTTHKAVDLNAPDGSEVVAMFDGIVIKVDNDLEKGQYVIIDHGDNLLAIYASLSNTLVIEGQMVARGEQIGEVSTSAGHECENGAHLHLEVYKNDQVVDPMPYVNGQIFREIETD